MLGIKPVDSEGFVKFAFSTRTLENMYATLAIIIRSRNDAGRDMDNVMIGVIASCVEHLGYVVYQSTHLVSGFMLEPAAHWKAHAKFSEFMAGPLTRHLGGECTLFANCCFLNAS